MLLFRIWDFLRTVVGGSGSVVGKSEGTGPSLNGKPLAEENLLFVPER